MKKKRFIWMVATILLCGLTVVSFTNCSDDSTTPEEQEEMSDADWAAIHSELQPQLIDSASVSMHDFFNDVYENATQSNDPDELLASWAKTNRDKLYQTADSVARAEGGNSYYAAISSFLGRLRLKTTNIEYSTIAADGSKIRLTTLVAWPYYSGLPNPKPDHVILGCHCTVGSDAERPTNYTRMPFDKDVSLMVGHWASADMLTQLFLEALSGGSYEPAECLVVMPDYEGFGNTKDRSHPYLNREAQARQCMDAALAGIDWYIENEKQPLEKNWKMVSVGYSQGGAVSAGTYRYFLEHKKDYPSGLKYVGAVCGDGPYNPFATLKYYCDIDVMDMPCAPAMMVKGLFDSDAEMIASGNQLSDYLTEDFINTGIFDGIASKNKTTNDLDEMVYKYIKDNPDCSLSYNGAYAHLGRELRASTVLLPDVFEFFKNGTLPTDNVRKQKIELLARCLKKNALFYKSDTEDWTPPTGSQFSFFHGKGDIVVPFTNFQTVRDAWQDNKSQCRFITYDAGINGHSDIGTQFFLNAMDPETYLMLLGKWQASEHTSTKKTTF